MQRLWAHHWTRDRIGSIGAKCFASRLLRAVGHGGRGVSECSEVGLSARGATAIDAGDVAILRQTTM